MFAFYSNLFSILPPLVTLHKLIIVPRLFLNKLSDLLVECHEDLLRLSYKNSRAELFCKNDFPENFSKFTGKHKSWSLLFNKVPG